MEQAIEDGQQIHRVKRGPGRPSKQTTDTKELGSAPALIASSMAQIYAMRIWEGQSPDVPTINRVARIVKALQDQNLPLDITLPHVDAGRYLEAHK